MSKQVLNVDDVYVSYGPIKAVRGCSLSINEGEAVAVIGANGAGKSTLLRAISNLVRRQSGEITIEGKSIGRRPPHVLAKEGMLHVPEGRGTIGGLTVWENLRLSHEGTNNSEPFERALERVYSQFAQLRERRDQKAGNLSGGEQQMLALSRVLISPPQLLLIDEPSLGLAPALVDEAFRLLRTFQLQGTTMLLVEQNARRALEFAHRVYILQQGEIVVEGRGADLLKNLDSLQKWLGAA